MASSSAVSAVSGVKVGSSVEPGLGIVSEGGTDGACASSCTVRLPRLVVSGRSTGWRLVPGSFLVPRRLRVVVRVMDKQKGRGSRMGFRGPEGAGLISSGWITPVFWPTEGPHQVVLLRLLPESGTGRRKGIGLRLCHYCRFQCLGRSLIALTDGKARGSDGGRRAHGTEAGQTGALVRGAGNAQGDGRAIGHFDGAG